MSIPILYAMLATMTILGAQRKLEGFVVDEEGVATPDYYLPDCGVALASGATRLLQEGIQC